MWKEHWAGTLPLAGWVNLASYIPSPLRGLTSLPPVGRLNTSRASAVPSGMSPPLPSPHLPHLLWLTSLENLRLRRNKWSKPLSITEVQDHGGTCLSVALAYHTHFMEDATTAPRSHMTGPGPSISEVTEAGLEHQSLFRWSWDLSWVPPAAPDPHRLSRSGRVSLLVEGGREAILQLQCSRTEG